MYDFKFLNLSQNNECIAKLNPKIWYSDLVLAIFQNIYWKKYKTENNPKKATR